MVTLEGDRLVFRFPDVHEDAFSLLFWVAKVDMMSAVRRQRKRPSNTHSCPAGRPF